jgi:hypothetical protein
MADTLTGIPRRFCSDAKSGYPTGDGTAACVAQGMIGNMFRSHRPLVYTIGNRE